MKNQRIRLIGILLFVFAMRAQASPARLPVRHYTSADGLAQDQVLRLAQDGDGFLWIATAGGLSRFDGERFTAFGESDGLRGHIVNDIAVGGDGTYWVATEAGLFAFRPGEVSAAGQLFREIALQGVPDQDVPFRLLASRSGALWVGTLRRLWRVTRNGTGTGAGYQASPVELHADRTDPFHSRIQSLAEDPGGSIWVGSHSDGIFRVGPGGVVDHCPDAVRGASFVRDFLFPADGSVWTAYFGGVAIFEHPPFPASGPPFPGSSPGPAPPPARYFGSDEGITIDTSCLLPLSGERVLVGTSTGISEMRRSPAGAWSVGPTLDRRSGLPGDWVSALVRDTQGNVWAGLQSRGLAKILLTGFSTLGDAEEAGAIFVDLTTDRQGRLVALASKGAKALVVYHPEGDPPGPYPLSLPASLTYVGWGGGQKFLVDSRGSWWIATGAGVCRYDDPRREGPRRLARPPDAVLREPDGLPGPDTMILMEDSHGDVWISAQPLDREISSVSRWSRAAGRIERFAATAVGSRSLASRFLETRDGSLWILLGGDLVRHRDGRFEAIRVASESGESGGSGESGKSGGELREMYEDTAGRLWLLGRGAFVCEHPSLAEPRFVRRVIDPDDERLPLQCMVEAADGRLWFGTNQGLVRIDPATGKVRRFTVADGLVGNSISLCERDGSAALWFSDQSGLSRYEARSDPPLEVAHARIREIRIAGEAFPLPSIGAISTPVLTVPSDRRRLAVEFFSIHAGPGPPPRFQHRLEGSDPDWSAPASDRSVQYDYLAPGRYRFQVRTVGEDGKPSESPASVSLDVLAPLWQRAWFLALCVAAVVGIAYAAYRVRVARMLAFERIRTRIATDLHDDIGSSLSQIAILSQLARRRADGGAGGSENEAPERARADLKPSAGEALERITALSGELIDAMSDVVWAISPRWDTVSALVHRMRRFASELFSDGACEVELRLPEGGEEPVDPDVRRQIYLVFKEALHNVRRHAFARHVTVELGRRDATWVLRIDEDGKGFDPRQGTKGHGMSSMRRRAERLGGHLEVHSSPQGTRLELTLPEGAGRWFRRKLSIR